VCTSPADQRTQGIFLTGYRGAFRAQYGHLYFWVPIARPVLGGIVGGALYKYGLQRYLPAQPDPHSLLAAQSVTPCPLRGAPSHRRTGPPPRQRRQKRGEAGVPARDPTDANNPARGAGFWHGEPAPPSALRGITRNRGAPRGLAHRRPAVLRATHPDEHPRPHESAGAPGELAVGSTPDALFGQELMTPKDSTPWRNRVAARSLLSFPGAGRCGVPPPSAAPSCSSWPSTTRWRRSARRCVSPKEPPRRTASQSRWSLRRL
jgi:hypothetical protein